MKKKLAIILFSFLLIFIGLSGGVLYLLSKKPIFITPYPYHALLVSKKNNAKAEASDLLIVGDRMALSLTKYIPQIAANLKFDLKKNLEIYNWGTENEGLHRTLLKLKSLEKWPPYIIYMGGTNEWFEEKYIEKESEKILFNFDQFNNDKIISLIMTFPPLSRLFYKKITLLDLGLLPKNSTRKSPTTLRALEVDFRLYQEELKEFIALSKQKKSQLIIISPPLSLTLPPKAPCAVSTTNTIIEVQQEIEDLLAQGKNKEALKMAKELAHNSIANARTTYLLGLSHKKNAEFPQAKTALLKASIEDCYLWRGNYAYNAIMKDVAQKEGIEFIDFADQLFNIEISDGQVFLDDIFPHNLYFGMLVVDLTAELKKLMKLKE